MIRLTSSKVINGIQTGPYKNIYNPENFFVGKNGVGAANNWGDGYQTGELVHEDIMEMIDREADGSDSLEVWARENKIEDRFLTFSGFYDASLHSRGYGIWFGLVSVGKIERQIPQKDHPDVLCLSGYYQFRRRCGTSIQQSALDAKIDTECRFGCCP
jgi:hypothetical protein